MLTIYNPFILDDQVPLKMSIESIDSIPSHLDYHLEIILVLSGSITMREAYFEKNLYPGDIHFFNRNDLHSLKSTDEDNLFLSCYLNLDYLTKFYSQIDQMAFYCNNTEAAKHKFNYHTSLRKLLCQLYLMYTSERKNYSSDIDNMLERLVSVMLEGFKTYGWSLTDNNQFVYERPLDVKLNEYNNARIHRIEDYLFKHYAECLTLNGLAEIEHISPFYLSHLIKQATGLNFQQRLAELRVTKAEILLISTNKTISEIALEVGFSSNKYLVSNFKKWYGQTPSEYRKQSSNIHSCRAYKYRHVNLDYAESIIKSFIIKGAITDTRTENTLLALERNLELFLMSGEVYNAIFKSADPISNYDSILKSLTEELKKLPDDAFSSFASFLSEVCAYAEKLSQ